MATACYINVYNSHVDRGATVTSVPREHYEVDESEIIVGEPLPKLCCRNMVKAYNGSTLVLWIDGGPAIPMYEEGKLVMKDRSKTITIKAGEEVEVDSSSTDAGMGVSSCNSYCVRLLSTEIIYKGGWQRGSTIQQKLEGPIGEGEVFYPNGDHFKGMFHLSYARTNGPAYAAEGRYTFADGAYIERAWIHTSKDMKPEYWGLHGVYRIKHPQPTSPYASAKPDSIAMFLHGGKRYGFELVMEKDYSGEDKPWVREWFAGEKIVQYQGPDDLFQYQVLDWQLDETSRKDCTTLCLTLRAIDGNTYKVEQRGGDYEENQDNHYFYEPSTRVTLWLPNGDSIDHYGDDVRDFKPYDGYVEMHCVQTGMCRTEYWVQGQLKEEHEWQRDWRAAKQVTLPDPTGTGGKMQACAWSDGHISYNRDEWIYDGEVKNNRPEGHGVLVGSDYHGHRRYEGLFADGQYAEQETFSGKIMLHAKTGHKKWTVYSDGEWKYQENDIEAKLGKLGIDGFWNYEMTKITKEAITISFYDKTFTLTPGQPLNLRQSIEGDERSDGCVYDGDDYSLELTWN
jgi:hypothetical protein